MSRGPGAVAPESCFPLAIAVVISSLFVDVRADFLVRLQQMLYFDASCSLRAAFWDLCEGQQKGEELC